MPGYDRGEADAGQRQPPRRPPLSARAAADALGVNERTVRRWIDQGLVAAAKVRGAYRIEAEEIERARLALLGTDAAGHVIDVPTAAPAGAPGPVGRPDTTGRDRTAAAAASPAIAPAARAQLEAIRDEWLRPLVERNEELARALGRTEAERDRLANELARDRTLADQLVDALQAERDTLRAELDRVRAAQEAAVAAPEPPHAAGPPDPAFLPSVAAWRERTTRAVDLDRPSGPVPWWRRLWRRQ